MPWKTKEAKRLRWDFVSAVMNGHATKRALCRQFGISRQCGHRWWRRFVAEGRSGLAPRSPCPRAARRLQERWAQRVLTLRRGRPTWGPHKLRWLLQERYRLGPWPAERTI